MHRDLLISKSLDGRRKADRLWARLLWIFCRSYDNRAYVFLGANIKIRSRKVEMATQEGQELIMDSEVILGQLGDWLRFVDLQDTNFGEVDFDGKTQELFTL